MRVAILTIGRFHVLDLARELSALGHDVRFYSMLPRWRTRPFGLPDACNHWLGPWVAPLFAASRAARRTPFARLADRALCEGLDFAASKLIAPCDVFIGMSGMSLRTVEAMRRRGTRVLLERGSQHILAQREILDAIAYPGARRPESAVPEELVQRELAEYALADTVVVPAVHVSRSFVAKGFPASRLFRDPYGVSLAMFPPTPAPSDVRRTLVMTGSFSLRKGCDVLIEAVAGMSDTKLVHVGSAGDCPFPSAPWFTSVGFVPQAQITQRHARSNVAVLASREEGLAVVQAQALASGLPLVCTDRTGGEDLRPFMRDPNDISVVGSGDPRALRDALEHALDRASTAGMRDRIAPDQRAAISWTGYAKRYHAFLTDGVRPDPLTCVRDDVTATLRAN